MCSARRIAIYKYVCMYVRMYARYGHLLGSMQQQGLKTAAYQWYGTWYQWYDMVPLVCDMIPFVCHMVPFVSHMLFGNQRDGENTWR